MGLTRRAGLPTLVVVPALQRPLGPSFARLEYASDALVHLLALLGAGWAAALAWDRSVASGEAATVAALALYVGGMFALGGASAAYNLTSGFGIRATLRRLDHASIYLMIAGTYTPFCVLAIGDLWGGVLLGVVWTLCLLGAAMRVAGWPRREGMASAIYLGVGWIVVVALVPLFEALSPTGLILLGLGGVIYSVGVVFYLWDGLPFHRPIWHLFVLLAATCHAVAVFQVVVPPA